MKSWTTKNGVKIIRVLSGRSNAYLILKDDKIILADTGKKSSFNTLSKNIAFLNLTIKDITLMILTHTHFDHCQSAKKITEISDCQVIVSSAAADSIKNGYTKLPSGTFLTTKLIARLGRLIGKNKFGYEPFQPDIWVNGSYDLNIGSGVIRITETPGHSADSISLIVDNEIAIVGDAMVGIFKNSVFPPYADDISQMINSWGKLLQTDCQTFLPGHGRQIKRDLLQKEYAKYTLK